MTKHNRHKVTPAYKQMAFETAVRNPERYKRILTAIQSFVNCVLDDKTLLKIVSSLYQNEIVSSKGVRIEETSTAESISSQVIEVNSTRKADGGFPEGYASRFWTYMRTLSEMGFVYAQYNKPLKISFEIIDNNIFNDSNKVETFLREQYNAKLKAQTILRDYPDVVLRMLVITGFVSIQFRGKIFVYLNQDKADYINDLLDIPIELNVKEKESPELHFAKLEIFNKDLLKVVFKHQKQEVELDGFDYTRKISKIIRFYKLNEKLLLESIALVGTSRNAVPAFKYIAEPLKLEFFISLLLALKYGNELGIRPNYKADYIGIPISHAPGNKGDIEVYTKKIYWLIEVTLIRNKTQQLNNETTSVIRHFIKDNQLSTYLSKYLSFVAPIIHPDTKNYYDYSIIQQRIDKQNLYLKPYAIAEFVKISVVKRNFEDMKQYTENVIRDFKKKLKE